MAIHGFARAMLFGIRRLTPHPGTPRVHRFALLRPVHAVLLCLLTIALALPLSAAYRADDAAVEATRGPIAAERFTAPARALRRDSPRLFQPSRLAALRADPAPDISDARSILSNPTTGQTPIPMPQPRRKPQRPDIRQTITVETLPPLPDPGIQVATRAPIILTEALPPPPTDPNAPRIALVITAAGLNEDVTELAIDALPSGITFAFAPIGPHSAPLARRAQADGHTLLVEIPMEPINPRRAPDSPLILRTGQPASVITDRLGKALAQFPNVAGISNYLGARFVRSEQAAAPLLRALAARRLFLFENQPTAQSLLQSLANSYNVPYAAGHIVIDREQRANSIRNKLDLLERQARKEGVAIGVLTAYRDSVLTVAQWAKEARKRGIVFTPVTQAARPD